MTKEKSITTSVAAAVDECEADDNFGEDDLINEIYNMNWFDCVCNLELKKHILT